MLYRIRGDPLAAREHVFDQVDAAAWTVELVAEQDISRAGRGAKAAMSAVPQHLLGHCNVRIGELLRCEVCSHGVNPARPPAYGRAR